MSKETMSKICSAVITYMLKITDMVLVHAHVSVSYLLEKADGPILNSSPS
jgi:hypothetical protein